MKKILKEKIKLIFLVLVAFIGVVSALSDLNVENIFMSGSLSQAGVEGGVIPSGTILMFNSTCPIGWTRHSEYDGYLLRVNSTGVGDYSDATSHTHAVSGNSANEASHTHTANPISTTLGSESSHTHTVPGQNIDDDGTTSSESSHTHESGTYATASHTHSNANLGVAHTHAFNPGGASTGTSTSCGNGRGTAGLYSLKQSHNHGSLDWGAKTSAGVAGVSYTGTSSGSSSNTVLGTSAAGSAHSHTISDYTANAATSGAGSAHTHTLNVGSGTSGTTSHNHGAGTYALDSSENVPSYISVIYCKKD